MSVLSVAVAASPSTASQGFSAEALISLRADMLRFAQLQLRNSEAAEDMVQEAIEAALRHASTFAGQSSLKTWVFAILRNRIVDHLPLTARAPQSSGYRAQFFGLGRLTVDVA